MKEFSLLGFVEHLAAMTAEMVVVEHEALEHAAQVVENEAKRSIGEYQDQSGPFAAWDPLAEATMADRVAKGFAADEPELRTGEMRDSIEHKVIGHEAEVGSDSEILEWQELGTKNMPPRSILGGAAARKSDEVAEEIGREVVAALVGEEVFQKRLPITGE